MTDTTQPEPTEVIGPEEAIELADEQYAPVTFNPEFVQRYETGVQLYKRWVAACIRVTHARHWINHGTPERPNIQLQSPGAEALEGPLGITYAEAPSHKRVNHVEDNGQVWYAVEVEGWIESKFLKRRGYYFAAATSRDKFFIAQPGFDAERDYANVVNKALSHWKASAISRIAGLRNPDPQLLEAAGLKIADIPRPDYSGRKTFEAGAETISEPQTKLVWARIKAQNIAEEAVRVKLQAMGMASTKEIKKKDLDAFLRWVEAGGQEGPREPGQEG